jgi:leader peptidase (prepilin peptidase)/N-methyltransferase
MRITGQIIVFVYLLFTAIYDWKKKEIHLRVSAVTAAVLTVCELWRISRGELAWVTLFAGMFVGVLLIGISLATRGQIGIGDGIVLVITGMVLNVYENSMLLLCSLVLTAVSGMFLLVAKHVGRKYTLPFVPYIFLSYGVICLWELYF